FDKKEINTFWMSYKPRYYGLLEFDIAIKKNYRIDFYLFRKVKNQPNTTLEFLVRGSTQGSQGTRMNLIKSSLDNFEEPVEISPGEEYLILLNCYKEKKKIKFNFTIQTNTDFA